MPNSSKQTVMSRRALLRTGAGAGAGAVGLAAADGTGLDPVGEADAAVCGGLCIAGAAVGVAAAGAGVGYLAAEAVDNYLGDERDYSGYTGQDALHGEIESGIISMLSANERVLTSISNNIENSDNIALAEGRIAAVEQMNQENGQTSAENAMREAINGYYTTVQTNLLNHWNAQIEQIRHMADEAANHSNLSISDVFSVGTYENQDGSGTTYSRDSTFLNLQTTPVTLSDGSTMQTNFFSGSGESTPLNNALFPVATSEYMDLSQSSTFLEITLNPAPDSSNSSRTINGMRFQDLWADLISRRDTVLSDLQTFIGDLYSYYEPGEIPTEELISPITAATQLRQNYDGMQGAGAQAAMLGIPTTADFSVYLTLENDGVDLWCDIYTEAVPTDGDGNQTGFEVGTTYDPNNYSNPIYIAYEADSSQGSTATETNSTTETATSTSETGTVSDFTQIEQPFTINEVETNDGGTVDSFQTEPRTQQTSDIENLQSDLESIQQTQLEMQEEAQSGGGGGFSLGNLGSSSGIVIAAIAGGAAILLNRS